MKKVLALCLTIVLCLFCLASCGNSYTRNEFFSVEVLNRQKLSDMPVPPHVDNLVNQYGSIIYLNLTDDEYEKYVSCLLEYLKEKEDVYYLGYSIGSGLWGELLPYDRIAPITDSYSVKNNKHKIFFSTQDKLSNDKFLSEPVEICIIREDGKLSFNDFQYNTRICLYDGYVARSQWDRCGAEHTYDEGIEYGLPGSEQTITEYTCIFCGYDYLSRFIGDMKTYSITIADTDVDHYLVHRHESYISGLVVEMMAEKIDGAELKYFVNDTEIIPRDSEDGKWWIYEFIMPCSDVVIYTELVEQNVSNE